jgi:regulator of PEP synthase PpsR (kinase-PPPase family)
MTGPVELHVVSDATGATATRLMQALEAQFPDQEFEEIHHPRVETVDDLRLAVNRAKHRPAVVLYTLVDEELRSTMRALCRSAKVHYVDILGHPIDAVARVSGQAAAHEAGCASGARLPLLQTGRGDRVRRQVRRRPQRRARGGGHRPRRRIPHLEDAALDLPRVSRPQDGEHPIVRGIEPPAALFTIEQAKIVGLTIEAGRLAEIRQVRARNLGGAKKYAQLVDVYSELEHAEAIHRRLGCPVIEITELSIEETAHGSSVSSSSGARKRRRPGPREAEAARSAVALGVLGGLPRDRDADVLRASDAALDRASVGGVGRGVPRAPAAG